MATLETTFAGLKLRNPIIVSSSGLTDSAAKNQKLSEAGAGAIVLKSLFEEQIMMEADWMGDPNMYPEGSDYLVGYIREHKLGEYLNLIKESKKVCNIPIIASINCYQNADWVEFAAKIEEAGADALEINILALQTDVQYVYGSFEQRHIDILSHIKKTVKIPVIMKLGDNLTNPIALIDQLYANGAAAVVLFNRFYQPDIQIDNLTFTLAGNLLNRVDDAAAASAYGGGFEFKDGVKQANEYTYDSNGNLTKDLNKGISTITYNVLNLPNMVTFSDGSTIAYTYGADGTKLKTVHKTGSTTTTTDYCGNVVYENGVQKLLLTDEGYVTLSDGKYHYYLKDHQGNNRVVINQSGTVEEANHYYPFGGVFASSGNVQPYKYNGKEFDNKKGLNWYDYGARHYDTALGRFTTNDRFAEKYYSMSPYQYGANSPVVNIDVNGDSIRICTETQSFGHTWISVGEGSNMTVYSYGRYNGTNKGPDRSSNSLGNGSGVLLKLMGDEAKAYNDKKSSWWNVCICSNRCGR